MSDSELSAPADVPSNAEIEQSLKRVARELLADDAKDASVNSIRAHVETALGLDGGFFKHDLTWKQRSKELIQAAVEAQDNEATSPEKPKKGAPKPKPKPKQKAKPAPKAGTKRKSKDEVAENTKSRKKARKVESDDDASEPELDDEDEEEDEVRDAKPARIPAKKVAKRAKKGESVSEVDSEEQSEAEHVKSATKVSGVAEEGHSAEEEASVKVATNEVQHLDVHDVQEQHKEDDRNANGKATLLEDDESDLSSLLDEPPKKKRQKKPTASEPKSKSEAGVKSIKTAKSKNGKELSAGQEEIKQLQGWLVKCGIRKLWWKELSPFPTDKEKVKHLKKMLVDAGMTGRYSNEKAKQIKESRELAAELEAVEEFNERWGQGEDDTDDDQDEKVEKVEREVKTKSDETTKRRLPKGFVDFGDSGDEGSD